MLNSKSGLISGIRLSDWPDIRKSVSGASLFPNINNNDPDEFIARHNLLLCKIEPKQTYFLKT
jgi:hypothetical protein